MTTPTFSKIFKLSPDLIYFRGHFPGFPVLPAVGILNISHSIIESWQNQKLSLINASSWRFKQPLNPDIELFFEATLTNKNLNNYTFRVTWAFAENQDLKITEGLLELQSVSNH